MDRADTIVDDVHQLGLDGVELEYRMTHSMYLEMKPRLKTSLPVYSIHNFFPIPEGFGPAQGSGNLFLLSSMDAEERSKAVEYTIQTIEHAHELEAHAVVLHLGTVDMRSPVEGFAKLHATGRVGGEAATVFLNEQRRVRKATRQKHLDAVLMGLEELNGVAEKEGVLLGIENRYHFHEIPDFEEIGLILNRFEGGHIGYWHDIGHARVQENLGILRRNQLLDAYSKHMVGVHIHDVMGLKDHLAPGQGEIDWQEIKPYFSSSVPKILELNANRVSRKELVEGIEVIRSHFS
ncbi:MAG: sugar phosphate isomerase/epimerase [Deltaproteobacteria bacterium]|nr:sugar phosphate isomerase/epimerase [Deltaproteobacteria bacterium]